MGGRVTVRASGRRSVWGQTPKSKSKELFHCGKWEKLYKETVDVLDQECQTHLNWQTCLDCGASLRLDV